MPSLITDLKVAYVSDQHYPIEKADSEQVVNTVVALRAAGIKIELVVPRFWRTLGTRREIREQKICDFYQLPVKPSIVELLQLPVTPLRLEKYSHGLLGPLWAKLRRYDIIYTRNPMPAFVANKLGLRLVYETYRVYRKSWWINHLVQASNLLGIITHSEPSRASILAAGGKADQVSVIHNGFNPGLFKEGVSRSAARKKTGLAQDARLACYSGRLDREKGVDYLLELAERAPDVTFLLIGKPQKEPVGWIEKVVADRAIRNVRHLDWMTPDKLAYYLFASDILLIPPSSAPLAKFGKTVLPMKLFSYMAAGRPIICPDLADVKTVLNHDNAILIPPDKPEQAITAIHKVFHEPQWATGLSKKARQDSLALTWEARAKRIVAFLNQRLCDI